MKTDFPDCKLHFVEQRTPEWHSLRKGVLTASEFGPWLVNSGKVADGAREKAVCRILAQRAGCWEPPFFENEAMRRGTELEPEAVESFRAATGKDVFPVGFAKSIHGHFGCSPDGLIVGESCGFEGKCPVPATHIQYRRAGVLPDEYRFQVHGCMAVTGAKSWWFQSYSPGVANLRLLVERDQFTEDLLAALIRFSGLVDSAIAEEAAAWDREFGRRAA